MAELARPALLSLALALVAGPSCSLPTRSNGGAGMVVNQCVDEGAEGGSCGPEARCLRGLCRAISGADLPVVLKVSRSQITSAGASPSVYLPVGTLASLSESDGRGEAHSLLLPLPADAAISVTLPGDVAGECKPISARGCKNQCARDHSIAVQATLTPSGQARGLPASSFVDYARDPFNAKPPQTLRVSTQLPVDTYDVLLEPFGDEDCPLPPLLIRSKPLSDAGTNVINVPLSPPQGLDGTITADPAFDLEGYRAELVDARTGVRLSTVGSVVRASPEAAGAWQFGVPKPGGGVHPIEYYLPVVPDGTKPTSPYLRLVAPEGSVKPSFAWELATITVFDQHPELSLGDFAPQVVQADGRLELAEFAGSVQGVEGQVWLQSLVDGQVSSLSGSPPGVPSFFAALSLPTDKNGVFLTQLLPGEYEEVAFPRGNESLGIARKRIKVPLVGGGVLDSAFSPRPAIDVPVFATTSDQPVVGVPFRAEPTDIGQTGLERVFGRYFVPPRAASGLTDEAGHVAALLDEGLNDLVVQFPQETGFPWLVKARLPVPLSASGALRVSPPIEVQGYVFDRPDSRGKPVVRGSIRAYVELPQAPGPSGRALPASYVAVGEASIDASGRYRLLLPSRL